MSTNEAVMVSPQERITDRIPVEVLKERLNYDSESGVLTWKTTNRYLGWDKVGTVAGHEHKVNAKSGATYLVVKIDGDTVMAHRAAWALYYGEYPELCVDHINCDKKDNRIVNLRLATLSEQQQNKPTPKNNTSGYKGVTWNEKRGEWLVRIMVEGKRKHIGWFKTAEEGFAKYCEVGKSLHGDFFKV